MIIRLGYVSIALKLPKVTSSSTLTYTRYEKLFSDTEKLNKLKSVTLSNLEDLKKILNYNIDNNIHFYRLTSKSIPLATHPNVANWNYRKIFKKEFEEIGHIISESNMRVDTHPDQFNVLNSEKKDVVNSTIRNLKYHSNFFEDINYPQGKMVIHVGSGAGGKEKALNRFIENFKSSPSDISSRLIIENDDKTFNAKDVLYLCNVLDAPMVLDVHHHNIINDGCNLIDILPLMLDTWNSCSFPPKFHFSSPKDSDKKLDRRHADFINPIDFIEFIEILKQFNRDVDIMLETKKKDLALLELVYNIKKLRPDYKWIDQSTFEV